MELTEQQIERFSRHILLDEIGGAGQKKLLRAKVLIIGAGGLGSPASLYLAAAGLGTIGIVDADQVDLTNLQRQIVHNTGDIGLDKVVSAANKLKAINPDVTVNVHALKATAANIAELIRPYDFVVDGTDSFPAKYLINDACYFENIPFVHAGILRFFGQLMTVIPGQSTCCRCIFGPPPSPEDVPTCAQAGVLGVLPGVMGSLQATEAVKYVLGIGELLTNTLLIYDALTTEFNRVTLKENPKCPLCGEQPEIKQLTDEGQSPACDAK